MEKISQKNRKKFSEKSRKIHRKIEKNSWKNRKKISLKN